MKISVIILTYKPDYKLELIVKKLINQSLLPIEIIIINTISSISIDYLLKYPLIKIINIPKESFDHGGTRDLGVKTSKGDFVVFLTQDAVPVDNHLLKNLIDPFNDNSVICTYGRHIPNNKCDIIEKWIRNINYPEKSIKKNIKDLPVLGIKTYFCSNVCCAYRKKYYFGDLTFKKKVIFNEDMIFAANSIKAGYSVYYQHLAKVYHSHNYSAFENLKRNFDIGVSHSDNKDIFLNIKTEKEGIKVIKLILKNIFNTKKYFLIFKLLYISFFKYIGFFLGRHYKYIPKKVILHLTLQRKYW